MSRNLRGLSARRDLTHSLCGSIAGVSGNDNNSRNVSFKDVADEFTLTPEYKVVAADFKKSQYGIFARAECRTIIKTS